MAMSEDGRFPSEKLTEIHRARDEWEGNLLVGMLSEAGITAEFRGAPAVNLDVAHLLKHTDDDLGVFVLEHEADRARTLVREFLATQADSATLTAAATQPTHLSKERIHELREEVREERRTFEFLSWLVVVFLGSAAALGAIWPAWLPAESPARWLRWTMVVLLGIGAGVAARWAQRRS